MWPGGISYDVVYDCGVIIQWDSTIKWLSYPLLKTGTILMTWNVLKGTLNPIQKNNYSNLYVFRQEECKQRLLLSEAGLKISRRLCTPGNQSTLCTPGNQSTLCTPGNQSTWVFDGSHNNFKDEVVSLCAESNKICHLSMVMVEIFWKHTVWLV